MLTLHPIYSDSLRINTTRYYPTPVFRRHGEDMGHAKIHKKSTCTELRNGRVCPKLDEPSGRQWGHDAVEERLALHYAHAAHHGQLFKSSAYSGINSSEQIVGIEESVHGEEPRQLIQPLHRSIPWAASSLYAVKSRYKIIKSFLKVLALCI